MNKFLDFILRRPIPVLAIIAVITALLGTGIFKLQFENSLEVMMPKKDAEYILNEETKKVFGNTGNFLIFSVTSDNILNQQFLHDFENFHQDIEEYITYEDEKEKSRLDKIKDLLKKNITSESLISSFNDDPVFQRSLSRILKSSERKKEPLSRSQKSDLIESVAFSQKLKKRN